MKKFLTSSIALLGLVACSDTSTSSEILPIDEFTILYEDFDKGIDYEVPLIEGENGNAAMLSQGSMLQLATLNDSIPQGTFEFSFKPDENFFNMNKAALIGSDEGRLTFIKYDDKLIFYKNIANKTIKASGTLSLNSGWNKIAGQWDGQVISLYVNGTMIGSTQTDTGYSPSTRGKSYTDYGNTILVGYKSACCTDDSKGNAYTSGSFDNIVITSKLLY